MWGGPNFPIDLPSQQKFMDKHKEVEWNNISGTRDKMIHHYFGVDLNIVFDIIKKDIPKLKRQIERIKKELS